MTAFDLKDVAIIMNLLFSLRILNACFRNGAE